MPSRARNKTVPSGHTGFNPTTNIQLPAGVTMPPGTSVRSKAASRAGTFKGNASLQFLSLPRANANAAIGTVTGATLANYVNVICALESAQPGFIAQNAQWTYQLGAQMFGTE